MKRFAIFLLLSLASTLVAERPPVVKPRAKAQDYPAVQQQPNFTLAAAQLSAKQVRKTFVSNIGRNYLVVEIAVYPNAETKITPQDFALRVSDDKDAVHPADPQLMASQINERNQKGQDVAIYPVTTVTYSTGSAPNDPEYYGGRSRGVTTSAGVMVGVNSKKKNPKTSAADLKAMTAELTEKRLPAGLTNKPVAGYLYFPTSADQSAHYRLEYQTSEGVVVIPLVSPAE